MRGLLREQGLEDSVAVDSAGTGDWHAGAPPDERATAAARSRGIALEGAARVVARDDFDEFDLILAADARNLRDLRAAAPAGARASLHLLREFDPGLGGCAGPRRARPLLRRRRRLRGRARPGRGGLPRPARRAPRRRPAVIAAAAARAIGRPLAAARRVAGGDINDAWLVELDDGTRAFVKSRAGALPGEYATEAAGLALAGGGRARAPGAGGPRGQRRAPAARARVDRRGRARRGRRGGAGTRARARARGRRGRVRSAAAGRAARRAAARPGRARRRDGRGLAGVLRRAPARAAAALRGGRRRVAGRRRTRDRGRDRAAAGARRPARAARAPPRRPLGRQRARGPRRAAAT